MPAVNQNPDEYLQRVIQGLQSQVGELSRQQNFAIVDDQLRTRVQVGIMANGDYGVLLIDKSGRQQELLPSVSNYVDATLSTTSATPVSLTGSPTVTCDIGQSGDFLVTVGSDIGVDPNCTGTVYLVVDGGGARSIVGVSCSDPTNGIAANVQSTRRATQWSIGTVTPGSHTFTLKYSSSSGTANFSANWFEVQPI